MRVPSFLFPTVLALPIWGACLVAAAELALPRAFGKLALYLATAAMLSWSMFVARRSGPSDPLQLYLKAAAYFVCGCAAAALTWWSIRCLMFERCS